MLEKQFDFTELIDRRGSSCHKWDGGPRVLGRNGLLPFWVADMDFPAAPVIQEALQKRLDHGVFGYSFRPDSLDDALISWCTERHNWNLNRSDLLEIPGIVPFIHILVRTLTEPGDSVVIQEPVYFPFRKALERNGRIVADNPLVCGQDGRWTMDLENLTTLIEKTNAKLFILCSPHNPVGRVWSPEELLSLAELCREKGVTVVSDEIHADIVMSGYTHTPWLTLPENSLPQSIALVSPTKTFNIPGLNTAFAVIPDAGLRKTMAVELTALGIGAGSSSPLAYVAAEAAWRGGGPWLDALLVHLEENDGFLRAYLAARLPGAKVAPLEGSYLNWIDLRSFSRDDATMYKSLLDAGVWPSQGSQFGRGGEGYIRMNIACPQSRLEEGLSLISSAFTGSQNL